MNNTIYLIRHGLTESNRKKIYAGWGEEPLIQEGIDDLLQTARKLKELEIKKIYSSPIQRAVQTAGYIKRFLKVTVEIEDDLKEMKMGPWEGLSEEEVAEKFPQEWKIWNSRPSALKINGRETLKELQLRALKAVKKISDNSKGTRILAVTHVALIRVLIIHHNQLPLDDYRKIDIPNCGLYLLNNKAKGEKIKRVL